MFTQITTNVTRSFSTLASTLFVKGQGRPSRRFVPCRGLENLEGRKAPSYAMTGGMILAPMMGAAATGSSTFTTTNEDEVVNAPPTGVNTTSSPGGDPNGMLIFTNPNPTPYGTPSGPASIGVLLTA